MSDTINFLLPENQYYTDILYDDDRNLHVNLLNTTQFKGIIHENNSLMFPGCGEPYEDVLMQRIQVEDDTIKMELQTKDKKHSQVIKEGAAKCGFKVK
ncbi:hypothetical protein [Wolbachia endosymbiont of Folsomia candida]|uniref:hypothetical protein n=1 Tax=Wolbachia endosymbiont of Folsomia candida TaxID=169402 RepID=UPI000AFF44C0|nr:hypothetical protein [Wolbachia endosymbiont of Folsomia candida]APR98404.1 hypothetical protein ASM33_03910 [Wolbachia endosymbiont of Folsomia candida]